jgi:hypothetical protein
MTPKNMICLWFNGDAEDAARFYAATFPDSAVGSVSRAPADYPSGKAGDVLVVAFTVCGIPCIGLNGGPARVFIGAGTPNRLHRAARLIEAGEALAAAAAAGFADQSHLTCVFRAMHDFTPRACSGHRWPATARHPAVRRAWV